MPIYFRTLISREHSDNWQKGYFFSTHAKVPDFWNKIYHDTKSTTLSDYPLNVGDDVFTQKGLQAFLRFAPKYKRAESWVNEELVLVGELDGVCAFDNPQDTYNYGHNSVVGKIGRELYVDFEGE